MNDNIQKRPDSQPERSDETNQVAEHGHCERNHWRPAPVDVKADWTSITAFTP